MQELAVKTTSEQETILLAERLATYLNPGTVITLTGDLGVGKTTFTKGIAQGLGIEATVTSPTFTIIKEYTYCDIPLYHIDAYRLDGLDDVFGFEEFLYGYGYSYI